MPERLEEPVKVRAGRLGAETKSATHRVAPELSEEVRETAGARRAPMKLSEARETPGFHRRKDYEDTDRFLDGLENLSFCLRAGDELTTQLVSWCRTRKVHWSAVVVEGPKLFFAAQGEQP